MGRSYDDGRALVEKIRRNGRRHRGIQAREKKQPATKKTLPYCQIELQIYLLTTENCNGEKTHPTKNDRLKNNIGATICLIVDE
jgi:carbamoylphosphate synthase small subunit